MMKCTFGLPLVFLGMAALLWFSGWNMPVFLWLHEHQLLLGETLWSNLTMLGDSALTPLILVIFIRRRPDLLWAAVIGGVLAYAVSHGLKPVINEARPPAVLDIVVVGPRLLHSSFPSGHTTSIFALAGLLVLGLPLKDRWARAGVLAVAVLVGLSRIGVGVHWPVDVLCGALIGWLCAAAGLALARRWPWGAVGAGRALPVALLLLLAVYNLQNNHTGFNDVWLLQKGLSVLALVWGAMELYRWRHDDN
jgi:membrane-associated phospholipid phosphatase